jgi:ATP-dependent 26S proteasome regulatory subunit
MPFPPAHPAARNNLAIFNISIVKTNSNQPAIASHRKNPGGKIPPRSISSFAHKPQQIRQTKPYTSTSPTLIPSPGKKSFFQFFDYFFQTFFTISLPFECRHWSSGRAPGPPRGSALFNHADLPADSLLSLVNSRLPLYALVSFEGSLLGVFKSLVSSDSYHLAQAEWRKAAPAPATPQQPTGSPAPSTPTATPKPKKGLLLRTGAPSLGSPSPVSSPSVPAVPAPTGPVIFLHYDDAELARIPDGRVVEVVFRAGPLQDAERACLVSSECEGRALTAFPVSHMGAALWPGAVVDLGDEGRWRCVAVEPPGAGPVCAGPGTVLFGASPAPPIAHAIHAGAVSRLAAALTSVPAEFNVIVVSGARGSGRDTVAARAVAKAGLLAFRIDLSALAALPVQPASHGAARRVEEDPITAERVASNVMNRALSSASQRPSVALLLRSNALPSLPMVCAQVVAERLAACGLPVVVAAPLGPPLAQTLPTQLLPRVAVIVNLPPLSPEEVAIAVDTHLSDVMPSAEDRAALARTTGAGLSLGEITRMRTELACGLPLSVSTSASVDLGSSAAAPVRWDDIGGHDGIKARLKEAILWPLERPQALKRVGAPLSASGVLLHGPPGTGKTLLAKGIATATGSGFIGVAIPDLIKSHVGASERAIRDLFRVARQRAPCVVFIDEVQAVFGSRDSSGALGQSMISQLIVELDRNSELAEATDGRSRVVIVGATNALHAIDPSLLRPGRFELVLPVLPPDAAGLASIFSIAIRATSLEAPKDLSIQDLVIQMAGKSGAEVVGLVQSAARAALQRSPPELRSADFFQALPSFAFKMQN